MRGILPASLSQGGLIGLSDRVEAAEGILTITSAAGSGTTLRASLPVAGPAASE